jgi:hypothetical protein
MAFALGLFDHGMGRQAFQGLIRRRGWLQGLSQTRSSNPFLPIRLGRLWPNSSSVFGTRRSKLWYRACFNRGRPGHLQLPFRGEHSNVIMFLSCSLEAAANVTGKPMRRRLTLALAAAAFIGGPALLAHAQAPGVGRPPPAPIVTRHGGVAGTGIGFGAGAVGQHLPLIVGTGHVGAGTNGISGGIGNATGGVQGTARVGTGGMGDNTAWGSLTGGVLGSGRGLGAGTGGLNDRTELGLDTGGINGSGIGSGVGGLNDLNSLGAGTGGTKEQTAPRFRVQ